MPKRKFDARGSKKMTLVLPATLAATVDELLHDPVLGKPKYGERSRLITRLLKNWVDEKQTNVTKQPEEAN